MRRTELVFYLQERSQTGVTKRLQATDVYSHLSSANIMAQLKSQLAVNSVLPKTGLSGDQLKAYLDNPPAGEPLPFFSLSFSFLFFLLRRRGWEDSSVG